MSVGDKIFAVRLQTTQQANRGMIEDCVIWKWFGWRCTICKMELGVVLLVSSSLHASPVRVLHSISLSIKNHCFCIEYLFSIRLSKATVWTQLLCDMGP